MSIFSNDTGQDISKDGLGGYPEKRVGKTAGYFSFGDDPIFRRE